MLPPIDREAYDFYPVREPELLTHRQHDHGDYPAPDPDARRRIDALVASPGDVAAEHAEQGYGDDGGGPADDERAARRKKLVKRGLIGAALLFFVFPMVAFVVMYLFSDVPTPHEVAAQQGKTVTYFYGDGKVMGKDFQDGNRVILQPDDIPDVVKHAVYAAEDATFETNSGFDVTGIARAVWNQLTGGSGGGSTISQQYVKKATENEERTITRKATEIVKSFKMNNTYSKSEIITAYLNTIYFGRGAYGIEAASRAYFDKGVSQLEPAEAAFLAGIIQLPSRADDEEYVDRRWNYVMDQMAANNWLSADERAHALLPQRADAEKTKPKGMSGPKLYIKERVDAELETAGYSPEQIRAGGYKIYTTIDRRAQDLAEKTAREVMDGQPAELRNALVAVDPETGDIKAYYGGEVTEDNQTDWARIPRNVGSTMKPFDFVALLQQDKGPGETFDGTGPRTFGAGANEVVINNSEGSGCGNPCTVADAMEMSINTVFYDMVVNETGPKAVAEAAFEAGIPRERANGDSTFPKLDGNIAIGGGTTTVSPRELAAAYATFAADGIQRDSHLVAKVTTADDEVVYQPNGEDEPAFDPSEEKSKQIAGNVTKVLEPVLTYSNLTCAGGRDCAGKTGTHQSSEEGENAQAWMAGYSKSLSTAVWVGTPGADPIRNAAGAKIFGSGLPGEMWQKFMNAYHEGMPNEPFDEVEVIGKPTPPPAPPPQPEPVETREPEETREPTETEKPTETPEPTTPPTTPPGDDDGDDGGGIWPPPGREPPEETEESEQQQPEQAEGQ